MAPSKPVKKEAPKNNKNGSKQGADKEHSLRLEFENNQKLQEVCGRHDANLIQIEDRLGVQVVVRGNQIAIFGNKEQAEKASVILKDLYEIAESGLPVAAQQVDAALRLTDGLINTRLTPADLMSGNALITTPNKKVSPRSVQQHVYVNALKSNSLVFGVGPAGTGKTYLATALAIHMLVSKQVRRIILTRPVVEAGESLGFLPGTLEEKVDPYLRPFFDAMNEMLGSEKVKQLQEQGAIEIAPLAYMRGRTLSDAFIMLDEAQNTTTAQMKMFLTRLGEGSRMVISGDISQIDLKRGVKSGMKDVLEVLEGLDGIEVVRFSEADVVRHQLVSRIVQAYDERERQLKMRLGD
ncbi:MAG: phosphate starvation-inducible protein PhoH [Magnetococcales bacterium]|nr:phosphate starvation-inducible protein PhoH [Magnetococcales bacterium]|tara:strand:+ start:431290 stop:432345 length:1056 start_codon:yes stop_codon:yes gene_type:complete